MAGRKEILKLAVAISKKAGHFLRRRFYDKKKWSRKQGTNEWLTPSDIESEELIRNFLSKHDPKSGILGEEWGWSQPDAANWWCIDPLDGTSNFIKGVPYFSVSIAYMEKGIPTVGVVYDPVSRDIFTAEKGKKAFFNQVPLNLKRDKKPLSESPFFLSYNMSLKGKVPSWVSGRFKTAKLRNFGSMALQLSYAGRGLIDCCVSDQAHIWDIAAGGLVLSEAGGRLYNFSKKPFFPVHKKTFIKNPASVTPFVAEGKIHSA